MLLKNCNKRILSGIGVCLVCLLFASQHAFAQTCTISGSGTIYWDNSLSCDEGGVVSSSSTVIVPSDVILVFDDNNDTWTGDKIVVEGFLEISANITLKGDVVIKNGGELSVDGHLDIGKQSGCGYVLVIEEGGRLTAPGGNTGDKIKICGNNILNGGTHPCNDYCIGDGIEGPTGYTENGQDETLPIDLLSFTAHYTGQVILFEWATASEENNDYFTIEYSMNGASFHSLAEVPGVGNSTTVQNYTYQTPPIARVLLYFRLKQTDFDGKFTYSKVISLEMRQNTGSELMIYPNPTRTGVFTLEVPNHDATGELSIRNVLGHSILQPNLPSRTYIKKTIDLSTFGSGIYFITFKSASRVVTKKLIFE
ncbi:T9SS type A sorting domain-containing protein [Rapidithrix thailandica]|uniref:T9SS type A sorting domain-containing protein n=1 Tax=Rapidithrix thailandica TaxID=413964 RepID=A0AAW9S8G1_9BACT